METYDPSYFSIMFFNIEFSIDGNGFVESNFVANLDSGNFSIFLNGIVPSRKCTKNDFQHIQNLPKSITKNETRFP